MSLRRAALPRHKYARRLFDYLLMAVLLISQLALAAQPVQSSLQIAPSQPDDVSPGVFILTGSMKDFHANHTTTVLQNSEVLVTGGTFESGRSCELYNPTTGVWRSTGGLRKTRQDHTATLLPDGRVLVAGGKRLSDSEWMYRLNSELYDPVAGSWSYTGNLNTARSNHTATLLLNGKVLVAGGHTDEWGQLNSAELYDPLTGVWSSTGNMQSAHVDHKAVRLLDGRVLVLDGSSAEIYDPNTGMWSAATAPSYPTHPVQRYITPGWESAGRWWL